MNVLEALGRTREALTGLDSPRLESERLIAHALGVSSSELILKEAMELTAMQQHWLTDAIRRRRDGEPLAYILQTQGFYMSDFFITNGVLIPRPETENIVVEALRLFQQQSPVRFADLGCGSGCIGLSLVREWASTVLVGLDNSQIAIQTSQENARRLGVAERCQFVWTEIEKHLATRDFDLVVANPPYIASDDGRVEPAVRKFEPGTALFAEGNGLAEIYAWSKWSMQALKPGGWWITEIGTGQNEQVEAKLFELGFRDIEVKRDLAGHWRTVLAKKP